MNVEKDIKRLAKNISRSIIRWEALEVEVEYLQRVDFILDFELEGYEDKAMARSLVMHQISISNPTAYELMYEPIGMTQDGVWTSDKTKWA